jgi:hypothetical protein
MHTLHQRFVSVTDIAFDHCRFRCVTTCCVCVCCNCCGCAARWFSIKGRPVSAVVTVEARPSADQNGLYHTPSLGYSVPTPSMRSIGDTPLLAASPPTSSMQYSGPSMHSDVPYRPSVSPVAHSSVEVVDDPIDLQHIATDDPNWPIDLATVPQQQRLLQIQHQQAQEQQRLQQLQLEEQMVLQQLQQQQQQQQSPSSFVPSSPFYSFATTDSPTAVMSDSWQSAPSLFNTSNDGTHPTMSLDDLHDNNNFEDLLTHILHEPGTTYNADEL